jgi:mannose-6-phosphate isomerase-like protein (cupin superfamily)
MPTSFRRVVTGHDASGKAVVLHDSLAGNVKTRPASGTTSTLLWVTDDTPARLSGGADPARREVGIAPPPTGSILRIVEYPPEGARAATSDQLVRERQEERAPGLQRKPSHRHSGMHRTESVDYAIVLSGEIDMLLDDSEVHLKAGDIVIQQGTYHAWANRGPVPCVIAFTLIGAKVPWA